MLVLKTGPPQDVALLKPMDQELLSVLGLVHYYIENFVPRGIKHAVSGDVPTGMLQVDMEFQPESGKSEKQRIVKAFAQIRSLAGAGRAYSVLATVPATATDAEVQEAILYQLVQRERKLLDLIREAREHRLRTALPGESTATLGELLPLVSIRCKYEFSCV